MKSSTDGLFGKEPFAGFGPSRMFPADAVPLCREIRSRRASVLREKVRKHAPRLPGVYGMLNRHKEVIYIGKAKDLRCRLLSYFREKSREGKAGRIIENTRTLVWETQLHELTALLRELELIRRFRPRFNVLGIPGRRRSWYLAVGRSPAPHAYLTREPTGKEVACYGPLISTSRAREAIRRLNDVFGLRDCASSQKLFFEEERSLFPLELSPGCLRYEIATCLGPCIGATSREQYGKRVEGVMNFLDGKDLSILKGIEEQMRLAAGEFRYEQALALRDKHLDLAWLSEKLIWLTQARYEHTFIYPLPTHDGRTLWYFIHQGQVKGAVFEPEDAAEKEALRGIILGFDLKPPKRHRTVPKGSVDSILLIAGWFRKYPEARQTVIPIGAI